MNRANPVEDRAGVADSGGADDHATLGSFLGRPATFPAALGGLVFGWWSLTPSLLPRSWLAQSVVSALAIASGYGIGAFLGWLTYRVRSGGHSAYLTGARRRRAWQLFTVGTVVAVVPALVLWVIWQNRHRDLVLLDHLSPVASAPMVIATAVVLVLLLGLGRVVAWLVYRLERFTSRYFPTWVAVTITSVVVVAFGFGVMSRAGEGFRDWSRDAFGITNRGTDPGIAKPASPLVSGSPDSLIPWNTLGRQGRTFVATAPTTGELREFFGGDAQVMEPIRIYAGLQSARSPVDRAALVVDELERTGGFDREALVVVTVTGTGWVDPDAAVAVEYLYGGDTAIVAMQYSYLPSWISFLVDAGAASEAAEEMNAAIRDAYLALPEADRPRLLAFAESLGSLGSEQATIQNDLDSSLDVFTTLPDGALFSGPTYGNPMWRQLIDARQEASPVWAPVYDQGRTARVSNQLMDFDAGDASWGPARVGYLHHPSDPVGYWNFSLLWRPPRWTSEPIGRGVSPNAGWFPIVTFWQVVADLIAGFSTDPGFGHNYAAEFVDAWAAVAAPEGWTHGDTVALQEYLEPLQ